MAKKTGACIADKTLPENLSSRTKDISLEAQDVLEAFLEEDKVTSAEYKDGVFHIETAYGPVRFKLFGNAGDKEDA